ncbi:MAG TPA: hypothetical protein VMW76_09170 [Bacteroidales bacterium]|nr:hypothetical protein [Bacteroidales bacterium]
MIEAPRGNIRGTEFTGSKSMRSPGFKQLTEPIPMNGMQTGSFQKNLLYLIVPITFLGIMTFSCKNHEPVYSIKMDTLNTRSDASIRALHVVNDRVVWAGGSESTFLLTTDGGSTWKSGTVPGAGEDEFRCIHAWSADKAILFGVKNPGRGYLTTTAGEYWEMVYENSSEGIFFNSLNFADISRGIALSDPLDSTSFLIRTGDGGINWEPLDNLPKLNNGEFNFAASNSCIDYHPSGMVWFISGGGGARLFRSENHGDTWEVFETGIAHETPASGIFSVNFIDDSLGIIVGGTYDNPELNIDIAAWSADGGRTWNLSEKMPAEYRSSVIWLETEEKRIALAAGKTGFDYSLDGGRTWNFLSSEGYYTVRGIDGKLEGYAAGSKGRISRFRLSKR